MHGPINVKSPNNTGKWQMGFNSAFKGLTAFAFTLEHGGGSVVGRGLARPQRTTLLPPRSKEKPEAVNAVVSS
jgi:hypothetical protein